MGGEDTDGGGHEFVCDGRDANNKFHINWGWEGDGNGYFAITSLKPTGSSYNFSTNLDALIGLRPAVTLPDADVTWMANGVQFDQTVAANGRLSFPTDTPDDCENGKKFMGWTSVADYEDETSAPTYAKVGDLIESATTFYAVYATETEGSGSTTFTFTPGTDQGETSVTKGSVTCTMTTMNNNSYYQIYANESGTFTCSAGNISKIEFTCTASGTDKYGPGNATADVGNYSYSGNTGTWTGDAASVTLSSSKQIRMTSLSITAAGGSTYSDYSTECGSGTPVYYTIRFFNNGAQVGETQTVQKGQQPTVPSNPTPACDNYTFVGWWTSALDANNTEAKSWVTNFRATKDQDYYAIYSLTEGGGSPVLTDNYAKITTTDELATGNYIVVGYYNSSKYYAMKNDTKANYSYYIDTKEVTPSSDIINTTDGSIIWKLTVDGSSLSFYNESASKYVYLYQNDTHYNVGFTTNTSDNINFTYTVSGGSWDFVSTVLTGYHLESYGKYSEFSAHTAAGDPIYLYKQQEENTGTTYYSSVVSCTGTAIENSEVETSFMKILRNGQVLIIRDGKIYNVLGQPVQ